MGRNKKVIALLILTLVFNCITVYASDNGKSNFNKDRENKKKQINRLGKQQKSLSTELDSLDKEMSKTGEQLDKVEKQLAKINENIKNTTKELKEAEKKLGDKKETFNSRLRVMYKNGSVGYIEVLLSAANIRDFLVKKDMVQAVVDHDVKLLKYMKKQRKIIDNKKKELQTQRVSAEATKRKMKTKEKDLMVATRSKQALMKKVSKDKSELERQLNELDRESKRIAIEISKQQVASNSRSSNISGNASGGAMAWPTNGPITSSYGPRWGRFHSGIDIGVPAGTPVVAARDGVVILKVTGYGGGYGNYLVVDHGGGISTLYAHNSSLSVGVGTRVKQGQQIALSGNTGRSTGPHLHFEVRVNGRHINPIPYLR